jgi:hypothetical protein
LAAVQHPQHGEPLAGQKVGPTMPICPTYPPTTAGVVPTRAVTP